MPVFFHVGGFLPLRRREASLTTFGNQYLYFVCFRREGRMQLAARVADSPWFPTSTVCDARPRT